MPAAKEAEKRPCQYCGRKISSSYMQSHIRKQHQIYGGRTGRPRRRTQEDFSQPTEHPEENGAVAVPTVAEVRSWTTKKDIKEAAPRFHLAPFVLLEDQDGGLWIAEKLR